MGSRSDIIEVLTADHRRIQSLFDRIRSSRPDSDERKALVEQVGVTLVRHSVAEKKYLHPTVRRFVADGDTWTEHELAEHREFEELLDSLQAQDSHSEEFGRLLLAVVTRMTQHIVEEEQLLFPRLQAMCPADVLQELGEKVRGAEASAPIRPRPGAPESAPLTKAASGAGGPWGRLRVLVTRRGRQ
ncbi:hemerythrin domain-containing protein [Streptomyces colonosanans]|uniref:Hemerythrin HHE cation-binding protein n=1 Tax=Streptomyces colonosanans TaxID=1428652 RepID=A0A1S2Q4E1_9ACTN|nr:hemerythrin domain-containing protein [Streptomyces colonosanans]OIK01000.1 hemerythrin HHE cation-binding protein [Streptomyces colonosanans]